MLKILLSPKTVMAYQIVKRMKRKSAPVVDKVAKGVSVASSPTAVSTATMVVYGGAKLTSNPKVAEVAMNASQNTTIATLITYALKRLIGRERPGKGTSGTNYHGSTLQDDYHSFPSGHAAAIAAAAGAIPKSTLPWLAVSVGGFLVTALVSGSRVHRGRHRATDVLGGCVIGLASAQAAQMIRDKMQSSKTSSQVVKLEGSQAPETSESKGTHQVSTQSISN